MAVTPWLDDDTGYEQWLADHPDGFMANLNREPHRRYFRIHRATHRLPDRSNPGSINPRTGNNYSKLTADHFAELLEWAHIHLPTLVLSDVNFCKTCNPDSSSYIASEPTSDPEEYNHRAAQMLARGPVLRPTGVLVPKIDYSPTTKYYRDPEVRAWVLQRANGNCELCNLTAPFITANDDYYLESHHLILLSQGGADTPLNSAALCPNCHRKIHYGKEVNELRESLTKIISDKEALLPT